MGCSGSKATATAISGDTNNIADRPISEGSSDSGIGLSIPQSTSTTAETAAGAQSQKAKKNIAFDVPVPGSKGIIKRHPPRTQSGLRNRSAASQRSNRLPSLSSSRKPALPKRLLRDEQQKPQLSAEEIQRRQEQAEQKREMDRLAKLARLRRRNLRAQKIMDRKNQQREMWKEEADDELSDVDQTFNVDGDFGWDDDGVSGTSRSASSAKSIPVDRKSTVRSVTACEDSSSDDEWLLPSKDI